MCPKMHGNGKKASDLQREQKKPELIKPEMLVLLHGQ